MVNRNHPPSGDELSLLSESIQRQFELEKWWVEDARERDIERNHLLIERGRPASDTGVRTLIKHLSEQLAFDIMERTNPKDHRRFSINTDILKKLLQSIQPYELAYLVLSTAVNSVLCTNKGFVTLSSIVVSLADVLEQEMRLRVMTQLEPELPSLVQKVLKDSRAGIVHRRRVFVTMFHKRCEAQVPVFYQDNHTRIKVGTALVELLLSTPQGLQVCKAVKTYIPGKKDLQWTVKPTEQLRDLFWRELDLEWLGRRVSPLGIMLNQPGKRSANVREMIFTRDCAPIRVNLLSGKPKAEVDKLAEENMNDSAILDVLTYLEQIPFRINTPMLDWVKKNKGKLQRAGVLKEANKFIPDCPVPQDLLKEHMTDHQLAQLQEWKKLTEKVHNQFELDRVQVIKQNRTLALATKLSEYDKFYYRWYSDFRGRLYPQNNLLHFQSSSLGKSLLEFSEQVQLRVGDYNSLGWRELVEYGLRLHSEYSKVPDGTLKPWVTDESKLAGLVMDFLSGNWVNYVDVDIKKKDFLPYAAWMLELERLLPQWGQQVSSGHPLRKDATCSSMQHMAALSGDANVLRLTNCTRGASEVFDLYTGIVPDYKEQGLDRDWIKKFIMTWAYNSTDYQRRKDIVASFSEKFGTPMPYQQAAQMNDSLKNAANKGLGKIIPLQELLMEVYRLRITSGGLPAVSVTPANFVVDSTKMVPNDAHYRIRTLELTLKFRMKDLDNAFNRVNTRKTRQAWVANIIHSLDASLLHIAIGGLSNYHQQTIYRVHLATIHDCVVTRPGDMGYALSALRSAFQYMYHTAGAEGGMPRALENLVEFWDLKEACPELYKKFKRFKAMPEGFYEDMRYFFI
jgi:DNA-directed RNA polymerase